MRKYEMKPLVIYHADCTDGFAAAFAAWRKFGDEAEYEPMQYGRLLPLDDFKHFIGNRPVYMLDFSLPRKYMDAMFENAKRVVWLDHHKTAFEMWCGSYIKETWFLDEPNGHYISLDDNKSGALLAWEHFHPGTEVPMLIRHIDDRDRWQFKLDGSKELHAALASYKPWSFKQWKRWSMLNPVPDDFDWVADPVTAGASDAYHGLLGQGAAILRAQDRHVASMAKQARKCEIINPEKVRGAYSVRAPWQHRIAGPNHMGYFDQAFASGLAVNATLHISEVGHELANQSGTFGLVWYLAADNRVKCSLRSNGDYDVSAIAKAFGGGGHRNAAGFETDINTLMGWLR